jgi:PhnB protein
MGEAIPMVSYEDVGTAADWLVHAFGFEEDGERLTDAQGRVTHADLVRDGARVMLGWPGPDYRCPRNHAEVCGAARAWLATPWVIDGVLVEVDDVDAHHAAAVAAGAEILREPEDLPVGRLYAAADPEGHRWMFHQPPTEVLHVP